MAADIKFRLLADDTDITGNAASPHHLTPYVLYRGMAVFQEYHEIYAKNEGSVLINPTHALTYVTFPISGVSNYDSRKVTGSAKDGGSTSTIYIAYISSQWSSNVDPTLIPDVDNQMANGRCYDLWTKYQVHNVATGIGAAIFRHSIGGSEPA